MAISSVPHSKNAYLKEIDITDRLEKKILDAYDVVYTSDTHRCFIISPELEIFEINSRVYRFDSVEEAESQLNENSDTYEGQIVSILTNERYTGYIVNKNFKNTYYVTALAESSETIDYDNLGNRPIINLTGTLDNKIIVDTLENGTYYIDGIYKISEKEETLYSSAVKNIFLVEHEDETVYIKKISAVGITDFTITDSVTISDSLTTEYLKENGYVTSDYVDTRLSALNFITKEEAEVYIADLIAQSVEDLVDKKIDEKIQPVDNEQLKDLFV